MNIEAFVNPYELFGIKPTSSLQDLRKSYYNLAIVCHPDKGGDNESMKVLTLAYKWIYMQLQESQIHEISFNEYFGNNIDKQAIPNFTDTIAETYGYTKEVFQQICVNYELSQVMQEQLYIPAFQWMVQSFPEPPSISEDWHTYIHDFLKMFKKDIENNSDTHFTCENIYIPISIPHGYGSVIEKVDNPDYYTFNSNVYKKDMTLYYEPTVPNKHTIASLDVPNQLPDYSVDAPIPMYDYEEAFTLVKTSQIDLHTSNIPIDILYETLQAQRQIDNINLSLP